MASGYPQTKRHLLCSVARGESSSLGGRNGCPPSLLAKHVCLPQSNANDLPFQPESSSVQADDLTIFPLIHTQLWWQVSHQYHLFQKKSLVIQKGTEERNAGSCGERVSNFEQRDRVCRASQNRWDSILLLFPKCIQLAVTYCSKPLISLRSQSYFSRFSFDFGSGDGGGGSSHHPPEWGPSAIVTV